MWTEAHKSALKEALNNVLLKEALVLAFTHQATQWGMRALRESQALTPNAFEIARHGAKSAMCEEMMTVLVQEARKPASE